MQIHIDTEDTQERERIVNLLRYALSSQREHIDRVHLSLTPVYDALGTRLHHCRVRAALRDGRCIEVQEIQSSCALAVTRALERCSRTIQRRMISPEKRRFA